jgi:hypothetical protein
MVVYNEGNMLETSEIFPEEETASAEIKHDVSGS